MGLRYGSKNLSVGITLMPFASMLPNFCVNEAFSSEIMTLRFLYVIIIFLYHYIISLMDFMKIFM